MSILCFLATIVFELLHNRHSYKKNRQIRQTDDRVTKKLPVCLLKALLQAVFVEHSVGISVISTDLMSSELSAL